MEIRTLTPADLDAVEALYGRVFPATPVGHLSRYGRDDHAAILAGSGISAGIFADGGLVAYQLWGAEPNIDFGAHRFPVLAALIDEGGALFNMNTVLAPEVRSRGLGGKLEEFTFESARRAGWRRRFAQVFHDNHAALRLFLAVDRTVVGLSTDEFGLNFVTATFLAGEERRSETGTCPVGDIERLDSILARERCFATRGRGPDMLLVHGEVAEIRA